MYCPKCGTKNLDTASFCSACGNQLSVSKPLTQVVSDANTMASPKFKKRNVVLVAFWVILTCWIYAPIWFLRRRESINCLQSDKKLGMIALILFLLVTVGGFISYLSQIDTDQIANIMLIGTITGDTSFVFKEAFNAGSGEHDLDAPMTDEEATSAMFWCSIIFLLQFLSFRVRRIMKDHFKDESFSKLATFFFTLLYLQFKMNRL